MARSSIYDISDRPRYKFKKHPFISLLDDPLHAFSRVPLNVLHVEDIRSYIHCKFESVEDSDIHQELSIFCNEDLILKPNYAHLKDLNMVKYTFFT